MFTHSQAEEEIGESGSMFVSKINTFLRTTHFESSFFKFTEQYLVCREVCASTRGNYLNVQMHKRGSLSTLVTNFCHFICSSFSRM